MDSKNFWQCKSSQARSWRGSPGETRHPELAQSNQSLWQMVQKHIFSLFCCISLNFVIVMRFLAFSTINKCFLYPRSRLGLPMTRLRVGFRSFRCHAIVVSGGFAVLFDAWPVYISNAEQWKHNNWHSRLVSQQVVRYIIIVLVSNGGKRKWFPDWVCSIQSQTTTQRIDQKRCRRRGLGENRNALKQTLWLLFHQLTGCTWVAFEPFMKMTANDRRKPDLSQRRNNNQRHRVADHSSTSA